MDVLAKRRGDEGIRPGPFLLLTTVAIATRLLSILLLPPLLDVYYYDAQAVQALLGGANPYGHLYVGVPAWLATPGAENVFVYLPAVVLFLAPFGVAWDVRLGLVVADLVVAWSIYALSGRWSGSVSLLYLLAPFTILFSTTYPNNTLIAMCFLGLFVVAQARKKRVLSGAMLGASLAASQFIILAYPLFLAWFARAGRLKEAAVSLAVAASIALPFFAWGPSEFVSNVVSFEFGRMPQRLITQMAFGFNVNPTLSGLAVTLAGVGVPLVLRVAASALVLVYFANRSRDLNSTLLNVSCFLLTAIFLLPSDFSWWYLELPLQSFLMWFVLSRGPSTTAAAANA